MTKSIFYFLTIVLLFTSCKREWNNPYDSLGNWVRRSEFKGLGRASASCFVINGKAYVGLGYNADFENPTERYLRDWWVYSPANDQWDKIADLPGKGRIGAVAFSLNGKGYVGTGFDGTNYLKDFWEYNPQTNLWVQKDDFSGEIRSNAVSFVVSDYAYVGTGEMYDGNFLMRFNDFYRFNPDEKAGIQWKKIQYINGSKRSGATAFTYDDKAYVCTGSNYLYFVNDICEYNPILDTWINKNDLENNSEISILRNNASSFVLNNRGYVLLGEQSSNMLKDVWEYDFENDSWTKKADFEGSARVDAVSFTIGDRVFVGTGTSGTKYLDDIWEYKPSEKYNNED